MRARVKGTEDCQGLMRPHTSDKAGETGAEGGQWWGSLTGAGPGRAPKPG